MAPKGFFGDRSPGVAAASQQALEAASADPTLLQGTFVTEPEAHPGFVAWGNDPVYKAWLPHIERPIAPVKELRGKVLQPVVCATLFGGLSSERQVYKLHGLPTHWAFSCDKKHNCVAWSELNFTRADVHYMDALDFLESDSGRDLFSGGELKDLKQFCGLVDILFVSTSCKPYSSARTGRKSGGSQAHEDTNLIKAFFRAAKLVKPGAMIFEQVFGFSLSESTSDPRSPLQQFLEQCDEELPDYERTVFVIDGDLFLVFIRHRIYIIFIRKDYGGAESLEIVKVIVQVDQNYLCIFYTRAFK